MELEKVLKLRCTTRKYKPEIISDADLQLILAAAQNAPVALGDDKTTHITVVRDPELMSQIREACMVKSRKTGKPVDPLYGAQTMIFVSATDISDDHIEYSNAACIIENMILQATALELGSTYIWGCLRKLRANEAVLAKLKLPEGYQILSALAVGYPDKPLVERKVTEKLAVDIL